jgi:hypothetical protein
MYVGMSLSMCTTFTLCLEQRFQFPRFWEISTARTFDKGLSKILKIKIKNFEKIVARFDRKFRPSYRIRWPENNKDPSRTFSKHPFELFLNVLSNFYPNVCWNFCPNVCSNFFPKRRFVTFFKGCFGLFSKRPIELFSNVRSNFFPNVVSNCRLTFAFDVVH